MLFYNSFQFNRFFCGLHDHHSFNSSNSYQEGALEIVKVAYKHADDIVPLDIDKFAKTVSSEVHLFNDPIYNDISPNIFSSIFPMDCSRSLDCFPGEVIEDPFGSTAGFLNHDAGNNKSMPAIFDTNSSTQSQLFSSEASFAINDFDDVVGSPGLMTAVSTFIPTRVGVNRKWRRLLPVFRLAFSVKRIVASKKKRGHGKG